MNKDIYYSDSEKLKKKIKNAHIIPYRITNPEARFKVRKKYYNYFWDQCFKVLNIEYDDNGIMLGNTVKWDDGKYGFICSEPELYKDLLIEPDTEQIYKLNDIVNTDRLFRGAEIAYWFFINNITCFNKKYKGFWKFVDTFSQHRISDRGMYKVTGDLENGVYINCKITRNK